MKTALTLSIAALMTLTACGGSSSNHDATKQNPPKPKPTTAKYTGKIETNTDGQLQLGSDKLYTVKTANGTINVKIDTEMKFPTGAEDIEMTGTKDASGAPGGAIFSKSLLKNATFGALADYNPKDHYLYNYQSFFQGEATKEMPNSGTATYQGRAVQFKSGAGEGEMWTDTAKGTVRATADFGKKTVQISLNDIKHPAGIEAASIVGNTFKGEEKGVAWEGGFFGNNAGEMAGIANGKGWSAAYGGVKK